ncbi:MULTISPECIES: hypothetical protein [Mesorhizobium]|nr:MULTISPECIES: hypothetical protein [Mesorhizobium]
MFFVVVVRWMTDLGPEAKVGFWLLGLTILLVAFFLGGLVGCALLDRS